MKSSKLIASLTALLLCTGAFPAHEFGSLINNDIITVSASSDTTEWDKETLHSYIEKWEITDVKFADENFDSTFYEFVSVSNDDTIRAGITNEKSGIMYIYDSDRNGRKTGNKVKAPKDSSHLFDSGLLESSYLQNKLLSIDCNGLDTSEVTDMSYMFGNLFELKTLKTNELDTSKTTDMEWMFGNCENLTSIDISSFNTENVTNMSYMFYCCKSLKTLDLKYFDTRNVNIEKQYRMYYNCCSLKSLRMPDTQTRLSKKAFDYCSELEKLWIPDNLWEIDQNAFSSCTKLNDVYDPGTHGFGDFTMINDGNEPFKNAVKHQINKTSDWNNAVLYNTANKWGTGFIKFLDHKPEEGTVSETVTICNDCTIFAGKATDNISTMYIWSEFDGKIIAPEDCSCLFSTYEDPFLHKELQPYYTKIVSIDLSGLDTRHVKNMSQMFSGCSGLILLNIEGFKTDNVTNMSQMFNKCKKLTSIDVKGFNTQNVEDMSSMFKECSIVSSLDVSGFDTQNVTDMSYMFGYCTMLSSLDLSSFTTDKVTSMSCMFVACKYLSEINIKHFNTDLLEYSDYLFGACTRLTNVTLPYSLKSIEDYTFLNCSSLAQITLPDSIQSIGAHSFEGCNSLEKITVPNSVTSIGDNAFKNCTSLKTFNIPDSVTSLGERLFDTCSSLTKITARCTLKENAINWNKSSPCGVTYTHVFNSTTGQCDCGYYNYNFDPQTGTIEKYTGSDSELIIPSEFGGVTVKNIAKNAFDSSSLTSITIPASVTSVAPEAFDLCTNLTDIFVNSSNTAYTAIEGVLFSKDITQLIRYPQGKTKNEYKIPDTVTNIGNNAFYGCTKLSVVKMDDTIIKIGTSAFNECSKLESIYYSGTEDNWKEISIGENNSSLKNSEIVKYNYRYVKAAALALDGTLKINILFNKDITEEDGWTINGKKASSDNSIAVIETAAKDFITDIVIKNGENTEAKFSVQDLLKKYQENDDTALVAIAIQAYCETSREYFSGETVGDNSITWNPILNTMKHNEPVMGDNYYGSTLLLKSGTILRHYYTEKIEGSTPKDGLYYVDEVVPAHMFFKSGKYSVNDYVYKVLNSNETSADLKNLCSAIYFYGLAAEAYKLSNER